MDFCRLLLILAILLRLQWGMPSLGGHLQIKKFNSILMTRPNKSPVSPWISANATVGPVPEEWQIWEHPARAETGHCNKWTDLSCGFLFHLSWKQFFFLLLQAQGYSLLCFVHFKGWGWGLKGKHENAAFKSLMCHIVPFKTRPCLCSREDWGMEDNLRKYGFGSSSLLDFSFVPLKIYFSNVYTTWKRLRTKGQLK